VTEYSYNGWPASRTLKTRPLTVDGVTFSIVDNDDVETVFRYIVEEFVRTVQPLRPGSCFGYNYRPNVNDPSELSNHSSGTALDINAEQHPNDTPTLSTFTPAQVTACHAILASVPELDEVVHWGGDWATPLTTDSMHWEIHDHDLAKLRRVADRIRTQEDYMASDDAAQKLDQILRQTQATRKLVKGLVTQVDTMADAVALGADVSEDIKRRITKTKAELEALIAELGND
jgi:hypothetical protein